jgi:hypothetical protein
VTIEIKSKLTAEEIKKSLKAAKKLKELKPFKQSLSKPRESGDPHDGRCRYFHCLFAYDSNLKSKSINEEYNRFFTVCKEGNFSLDLIDRLYIIPKGLLLPRNKQGIEETDKGIAFMNFFTHILNFIQTEDKRRKPTPYHVYVGKGKKLWKRFT